MNSKNSPTTSSSQTNVRNPESCESRKPKDDKKWDSSSSGEKISQKTSETSYNTRNTQTTVSSTKDVTNNTIYSETDTTPVFPQIDHASFTTHLKNLGYQDGDRVYLRAIAGKGYILEPEVSRHYFTLPRIPWKLLTDLQKKGYGLYIVVNGGGNKDKNVKEGKAFFCEFDDRPIDEQINFWERFNLPAPSLQIQTRKSVHTYWILDNPCQVETWRTTQTQLLTSTESDQTLKNPSRVMRLAGSWHVKDGSEPLLCTIIHTGDALPIEAVTEPLAAIVPKENIQKEKKADTKPHKTANYKPNRNKSSSNYEIPEDLLFYCLTKTNQKDIEHGVSTGKRNSTGAALARNLIGTARYLISNGEHYISDPQLLFEQFCDRCSEPIPHKERESIWKSAEGSNPRPSVDQKGLEKRINSYKNYWDNRYDSENHQDTSKIKDVPNTESANDPPHEIPRIDPDTGVHLSFFQIVRRHLYKEHYVCIEGKLFKWEKNHYQFRPDYLEYGRIEAFAEEIKEERKNNLVNPYYTPDSIKNALIMAKAHFSREIEVQDKAPGLNCTNGVLNITWENNYPHVKFVKHDPTIHYYFDEPVIAYNPLANPENAEKLLDCLEESQKEIFVKVITASLDLEGVRKILGRNIKSLLLKGNGANGKDALRNALANIYGEKALTSVTIADFANYDNGRKFSLSALIDCRVNWASENPATGRLDNIQSLKKFITGDKIHSERKGKDHVEFRPQAIGLFNINDIPPLRGVMQAMTERLDVLTFSKTYKTYPDPNNPNELKADPRFVNDNDFVREHVAPALLNMMLAMLPKLVTEGIDYTPLKGALEEIQRDNLHLLDFAKDEGLTYQKGSYLTAQQLWDKLIVWYQENGTCELHHINGKEQYTWHDQARPGDKNVTAINQVLKRFEALFPEASLVEVPHPSGKKKIKALMGVAFVEGEKVEIHATTNVTTKAVSTPTDTPNAPKTPPQQTPIQLSFHPSNTNTFFHSSSYQKIEEYDYFQPVVLDDYVCSKTVNPIGGESAIFEPASAEVQPPSGTGFSPHPEPSKEVEQGVRSSLDVFNPEHNAEYICIALEQEKWEMVESLTEEWSHEQKRAVWAFLTDEQKERLKILKNSQTRTTKITSHKELQIGQQYRIKLVREDKWVAALLVDFEDYENETFKRAMFTTDQKEVIPIYSLKNIQYHTH